MPRKRPERQLIKFGNYSVCLTLPKKFLDELGWQAGDTVTIGLNKQTNELNLRKAELIDIAMQSFMHEDHLETENDILPIPEL